MPTGYTYGDVGLCNCTTATCSCYPCAIPQSSITCSATIGGQSGSGTVTFLGTATQFTFQNTAALSNVGCCWETGDWTSGAIPIGSPLPSYVQVEMCCDTSGCTTILFTQWSHFGAILGQYYYEHPSSCYTFGGGITPAALPITSSSCSPFSVTWHAGSLTFTFTP